MKKIFTLLLVLLIQGQLFAQDKESTALYASVKKDARIDQLFEIRSALLVADSSTRMVDRELAALGVRFPAKVSLASFGGRVSMAFLVLDDYDMTEITSKLDRLRTEIKTIEYLGVDMHRHLCLATFSQGTADGTLERLLREFNYSGFYIKKEQLLNGYDRGNIKLGLQP